MFEDKTLTCRDCGAEFTFTSGEQEFYEQRGFTNEPKCCLDCRQVRKNAKRNGEREMFEATCDSCGGTARVPFRPSGDRPIYCSDCFNKQRD
ncbi:MAG: zinc-ribbon domain containing protein [Oscillospiraceae bacterium]|nr:zinc-ribbon domain containing protein [Oscillospiraceae bacterium]